MQNVIFFGGSGQRANQEKFVYSDWARDFQRLGCNTQIIDGVGTRGNWFKKTKEGFTGKGWGRLVQEGFDAATHGNPDSIVIVGMSRGGVQAVVLAHCLKNSYKKCPVFIYAVDPVQGWHLTNDGSFDLSAKHRGSRGELRERHDLLPDAPRTIPDNVTFYLSLIAQFKGTNRGAMSFGFTPQTTLLGNLNTNGVDNDVFELPGDHGYGVYTGRKAGRDDVDKSREARGLVSKDLFYSHARERGFGNLPVPDPFDVLNAYARIALEDIELGQTTGGKSGFSFLRASKPERGHQWSEASPNISRWHKGRGHLIKSRMVQEGHGYYVNRRHLDLWNQYVEVAAVHRGQNNDNRWRYLRAWEELNDNFGTPADLRHEVLILLRNAGIL